MKVENGPIIPGVCIGNIKLGITQEELLKIIDRDYKEQSLEMGAILAIENAKFWIASDGKVDQIGVENNFKGRYKGVIGLGSTLSDLKNYIGNYIQVHDTYELENEKGICFELEDVDNWNELTAPMDHIYVFRVKND